MPKKKTEKVKTPSLPPEEKKTGEVEEGKPVAPRSNEAAVAKEHLSDKQAMKDNLEKQPKVRFYVPLEEGEAQGAVIPVTLNGYRLNVPKGVYVDVPEQVAEILMDALRIPREAGKAILLPRPGIQQELSE